MLSAEGEWHWFGLLLSLGVYSPTLQTTGICGSKRGVMAGILPLLIALLTAHAAGLHDVPVADDLGTLVGLSLLSFLMLQAVAVTLLPRRQTALVLRLWDMAGLGILLGLNAWWCLALGWAEVSAATLLVLLGRFCSPSAVTGMPFRCLGPWLGGRQFLGFIAALAFGLLPVLLLVAIMDVLGWVLTLDGLRSSRKVPAVPGCC